MGVAFSSPTAVPSSVSSCIEVAAAAFRERYPVEAAEEAVGTPQNAGMGEPELDPEIAD